MFDSEGFCGYTQITTAFMDLSIAEQFGGVKAVMKTYWELFKLYKHSYKELTELVMVLNWKLWIWHNKHNNTYAELYEDLWGKADIYATENLKGNELMYFYNTTD